MTTGPANGHVIDPGTVPMMQRESGVYVPHATPAPAATSPAPVAPGPVKTTVTRKSVPDTAVPSFVPPVPPVKTAQVPGEPGPVVKVPANGGTETGQAKREMLGFGLKLLAGVAVLVAVAGTAAVATGGFALSFDAMKAVAIAAHIRASLAWLLPVTVDGVIAVATVAAVVLRRLTGRTHYYPWAVVLIGAAISVACNSLHATGEAGQALDLDPVIRMGVSAVPALNLALSVHLLVILLEAVAGKSRTPGEIPAGASKPVKARRDRAAKPKPRPVQNNRDRTAESKRDTNGTAPANGRETDGTEKARRHWDSERKAGRTPTGADLARAAGIDPSLGRRLRRKWAAETDTATEST